jgi:hypothetical protein
MTLNQGEADDSGEIADAANYIIENLERNGMEIGLAVPALATAVALLVAAQPRREEELMAEVITAILGVFADSMATKEELLAERQRDGATLQ